MYRSLIAVRYAKALFLKGKEDKIVEDIDKDIVFINKTLQENRDLFNVMHQPSILTSQKNKIVEEIFQNKINPVTLDFLKLVLRNKREYYLEDIFRNFIDIYNEDKGIKTAILTTTVELGKKEQGTIKEFIKNNFDAKEIKLNVNVDKDLIGGFIIQINDQLFDASVRRQLDLIRKKFLHRKWNFH